MNIPIDAHDVCERRELMEVRSTPPQPPYIGTLMEKVPPMEW